MKRGWMLVAGLLVISAAILIVLLQGLRSKNSPDPDVVSPPEPNRRKIHARSGNQRISGSNHTFVRMNDDELRREAIRLLLELGDSEGYSRVLLESRLSALFREWGNRNIEMAEQFLDEEDAAQGSYDGNRRYGDDLILAALMGRAEIDPVDAWARFLKTWANAEGPLIISPALRPLSFETAGFHLFQAYYRSNPTSAVEWIRTRDEQFNGIAGPALQVVMAATTESEVRQRLFMELCVAEGAGFVDRALVCAGVAEQDPEQAWEFLFWGRTRTDGPLTSESPETIASDMILHWSIKQPEQALQFILSPKREQLRMELLETFIMTQFPRRPELLIRVLEHKELAALREKFSVTAMMPFLMQTRGSWPLVDENIPLPPDDRCRVMADAVRASDLPSSLKADFEAALSDGSYGDSK